jgi:hypothetical protein
LTYSELNRIEVVTESMFLYPNGTVAYFREIILGITCEFDFKNIPSDNHTCPTIAHVTNEFNDYGILVWVDKFSKHRTSSHHTWQV